MAEKAKKFEQLLSTLNQAQRRAVDQIDGPMLVIAGPGTGKTHLLAARIGQILTQTDTPAQSILCLTFTDAAAHEMRSRLLETIGADAHRVPISTFHAFANRVIQENIDLFGRYDLEPISELERIEIIRTLLEAQPTENPLRTGRKEPFFYEKHLADLFSTMKKEGWSPGHVRKMCDEFEAAMPENPDFQYKRRTGDRQKGDLKTEEMADKKAKLDLLRAAADLFPKFKRAMDAARRYDFDDMIGWVVRGFEENPQLLRSYQERYLYFLIDEFQDTNGAQNRLVRLLADFWDTPNLFAVGDDDQSIYEFQGARLANLQEFFEKYQPELVSLTDNYRSSQNILDAAANLVNENKLRAAQLIDSQRVTKNIVAKNEAVAASEARPKSVVYENRLHELSDVVAQIEALKDAGEDLREVAILFAQHRQSELFQQLLERKNIPFQTRKPVNCLDQPVVRQFRRLLEWLEKEAREPFSADAELFQILHFRFLGFRPIDAAQLFFEARKMGDAGAGARLLMTKNTVFQPFSEKLEAWLAASSELALPKFLEKIVGESGLANFIFQQNERIFLTQCLATFLDFARKEAARDPKISLARLLEMLKNLDENGLALSLEQSVRTGDGVHLLTAHGSKGLEFRWVFAVDCAADFWEDKKNVNRGRFWLPATLLRSDREADFEEARRRLFYVAMTRAKEFLQLSVAEKSSDGKPILASIFLAETGVEKTQLPQNQLVALAAQQLLLTPTDRPRIEMPTDFELRERLEGFELSPTSMNRFLRCPLSFYYENVLGAPSLPSEYGAFGQAAHGALQRLFEAQKRDRKRELPSAEDLSDYFEKELSRRAGLFSAASFEQKLAFGKAVLTRFHAEKAQKMGRESMIERTFRHVESGGVPLEGTIDRLEFLADGALKIIDFKTGRPDSKKVAPPDERCPLGGDFWRQMAFYKIMLEAAKMPTILAISGPVAECEVAWLEPDEKKKMVTSSLRFSADDLDFVQNLISQTWQKIQNLEFSEGCGKADCAWCRLHLDNERLGAFAFEGEEALDD